MDLHERAREALTADPSLGRERLAGLLGIDRNRARRLLNKLRDKRPPADKPSESRDVRQDAQLITLTGTRMHTAEQVLEYCRIDTRIWEVERMLCTKHEMGSMPRAVGGDRPGWVRETTQPIITELFNIKLWLRRKVAIANALAELEEIRRAAEGYAPKYPAIIFPKREQSGNLLEISIADHHFGRLAWAKETGDSDYDTPIAVKLYRDAFTALLERTRAYHPDSILIVLGNDQQNADNREGTTTKGTRQDMDSRYPKVFAASRDASIWAIEAAREIAPDVHVLIVPGNHDQLTAWHLGDTLRSWFRNCPGVRVDNRPLFRKYFQHGTVMLMFLHGNAGKLEEYPAVMAAEQARMWGATTWHEAHTGDKHHRRLVEMKGGAVRILPSLVPADAWSAENCYIGSQRAAEAYVWNRDEALIGTAVYSVRPTLDEAT